MAQSFTIAQQYRGDTFRGLAVTVNESGGDPVDLTGAAVRMMFRSPGPTGTVHKSLSLGDGITIGDATAGTFAVDAGWALDMPAADYVYDIELTLSDGRIVTIVTGTFRLLQDVTR